MEVKNSDFWQRLPAILEDIAGATFVTIDFEMSGINPPGLPKTQTPTMHNVYARAVEATRLFRVLQMGITTSTYVPATRRFKCTTYNFHVSPMFVANEWGERAQEALARSVDRTLSISYDTLVFLKKNCLRLEDTYQDGIEYLSQAEEDAILPRFLAVTPTNDRDDVDFDTADEETKAFYELVRAQVTEWQDGKEHFGRDYINISNPYGETVNRFQVLLVHQLLAKEFPGRYRAQPMNNNSFIQVLHMNDESETRYRTKTAKSREDALCVQRGLRYVVDAMAGRPFSQGVLQAMEAVAKGKRPSAAVVESVQASEASLAQTQPILVGHNMFLDLCYLYATFYEPLPASLEAFGQEVWRKFKRVIDTKYMATVKEHEMMPFMNLEDLFKEISVTDLGIDKAEQSPCLARTGPRNGQHHAGNDIVFFKSVKDQYLERFGHQKDHDIGQVMLDWTNPVFQEHANQIRLGKSGILCLGPMNDTA